MGSLELFEKHEWLVETVARGFWNIPNATPCEIRQEARIALANAARRFDPARFSAFEPYARGAINNRLKDLFRRNTTDASRRTTSLDRGIGAENETSLLDLQEDERELTPLKKTTLAETRKVLHEVMEETLNERQKTVVLGFMSGEDGSSMGKQLGVTRQAIHALKEEAFRRIRWGLKARGVESPVMLSSARAGVRDDRERLAERLFERDISDFLDFLLPDPK